MDFFGLDLGASKIKIVQLKRSGDKVNLVSVGEIPAPRPGVRGSTKSQWAETAGAIKKLVTDLKLRTKNAVVSLPEGDVISRLKWFPPMKEGEVRAALEFEAETLIPHPLEKTQIDYEVVGKDEDGRLLVFIVAALKEVIDKHVKVVKLAGMIPIALETPAVSLTRIFSTRSKPNMILDFGSDYSTLIAGKESNVFLTRTFPIGSQAFIRSVSVSLGLDPNAAKGYYHAYGLREEELEGKVRESLMPVFNRLVDEIKKTIYSFNEEWREDIKVLVISGEGAMLPQLVEELVKILGIEVQVVQPFAAVNISTPLSIDINKEGIRFATVFGLATRNLK